MLYQAAQSVDVIPSDQEEMNEHLVRSKLHESKKSRQLASEITLRAADLYDELIKETGLRVNSLGRPPTLSSEVD